MSDEKKSKNPFVNMANAAKQRNQVNSKPANGKNPQTRNKFNNTTMVRRSGRGG